MSVDEQLLQLFSLVEEEKVRLKALIAECLEEKEYLMAESHQDALRLVESQLRKLNRLIDPLYDEKNSVLTSLGYYQECLRIVQNPEMKAFYQKQHDLVTAKLEGLRQETVGLKQPEPLDILETALRKLFQRQINNLSLVLWKEHHLSLKFSYSKKSLKLTLPNITQHLKTGVIYENQLEILKNLGFQFAKGNNRFVLILSDQQDAILERVKILMARFVFDVFNFKEFRGQSYISFTESRRDSK